MTAPGADSLPVRKHDWLREVKSTLAARNDSFLTLGDKLGDPVFRDEYRESVKAAYNQYLAFANYRTSRRSLKKLVPFLN